MNTMENTQEEQEDDFVYRLIEYQNDPEIDYSENFEHQTIESDIGWKEVRRDCIKYPENLVKALLAQKNMEEMRKIIYDRVAHMDNLVANKSEQSLLESQVINISELDEQDYERFDQEQLARIDAATRRIDHRLYDLEFLNKRQKGQIRSLRTRLEEERSKTLLQHVWERLVP